MNYLLVGFGGMLGSIARYSMSSLSVHWFPNQKFPIGTLLVNLIGCFLIGLIAALIERMSVFNAEARLLAITGFLGGFTTFSAFGIETFYLLRGGETALALLYVCASVGLGIILVSMGMRLFT